MKRSGLHLQENSSLTEAAALVETWLAQIQQETLTTPIFNPTTELHSCHGNPITYSTFNKRTVDVVKPSILELNDRKDITHHLPSHNTCCSELERPESDYVTKLEWDNGQVRDNVSIVLNGLLDTKINVSEIVRERKGDNPLITMEMRHKEVQRRRHDRDRAHKSALKEEQRKYEVRQRARHMIKKEEEQKRAKEKREELEIRRHMIAIRRQVQEQKERERIIKQVLDSETEKEEVSSSKEDSKFTQDKQLTKRDGTSRHITRMALLKQLVDAEAQETKTSLQLLHRSFISWQALVQQRIAMAKKAEVIGNWRLLLRCWRAWRGVVKETQAKRLALEDAERLRKERRQLSIAHHHYRTCLIRKCFTAWRGVVIATNLHSEHIHKERLISFLQAITEKERKLPDKQKEKIDEREIIKQKKEIAIQTDKGPHVRLNSKGVWSTARSHVDMLLEKGSRQASNNLHNSRCVSEGSFKGDCVKENSFDQLTNVPTTEDKLIDTSFNKDHLTNIMTPVPVTKNQMINVPPTVSDHSVNGQSSLKYMKELSEKPVTKLTRPVILKGMEERTALIAQRKLAREERKMKKEQEHLQQLEAKEEQKKKEEREAKVVEMQKRKEEKRLAQERERQRQARVEHLAALTQKAQVCYQRYLLCHWGIKPWLRFTANMKEAWQLAVLSHDRHVMATVWSVWSGRVKEIERVRETKVKGFVCQKLLLHTFNAWREYMTYQYELLCYASEQQKLLLLHKLFRGWERVTREERIIYWEKERRARKHYENHLLCVIFKCWRGYIPLSLEDKKKELRRAELRRKVSLWLPDYQPMSLRTEEDEMNT